MSGPILKKGFVSGGLLNEVVPGLGGASPLQDDSSALDEFWMKEAFRESLKAVGRCNPNPAVGCVLVRDGVEIARGHTQTYGSCHAERDAFAKVAKTSQLRGGTAYVTLEPCSHFGHQPPCVDLLASSQLSRVVIGRKDPDSRVNGRGISRLLNAGKKVSIGPLGAEITAWNHPFFFSHHANRPFFALKWAQTLDGQMVDDAARAYGHWLRQKYDAVLVGAGTFTQDSPRLTVRDCAQVKRQPVRIVFDPNGRLLEATAAQKKALLDNSFDPDRPTFVLVEPSVDRLKLENLFPGARTLPLLPGKFATRITQALQRDEVSGELGKPLQSVLVEGGPHLLAEFLNAGSADVIHAFISPLVTGGTKHRLTTGLTLAGARHFRVLASETLGSDTILEMVDGGSWSRVAGDRKGGSCVS